MNYILIHVIWWVTSNLCSYKRLHSRTCIEYVSGLRYHRASDCFIHQAEWWVMLMTGASCCLYALKLVIQLRNMLSIGWTDLRFMHWVNRGQVEDKPFQQPVHWAGTSPFGLFHPRTRTELRGTWEGMRRQSPRDPSQSRKGSDYVLSGQRDFFLLKMHKKRGYQIIPEVMIHWVTNWVKTKEIMKRVHQKQFRLWFGLYSH